MISLLPSLKLLIVSLHLISMISLSGIKLDLSTRNVSNVIFLGVEALLKSLSSTSSLLSLLQSLVQVVNLSLSLGKLSLSRSLVFVILLLSSKSSVQSRNFALNGSRCCSSITSNHTSILSKVGAKIIAKILLSICNLLSQISSSFVSSLDSSLSVRDSLVVIINSLLSLLQSLSRSFLLNCILILSSECWGGHCEASKQSCASSKSGDSLLIHHFNFLSSSPLR